jgi:hypothetical protein
MDRKGMFTASRIGDLLAGGTGKTKLNYIFDIALDLHGLKKEVSTKAMEHGIVNERSAIDILISKHGGKANLNEVGGQTFYKVNDKLGATPDALSSDWVGDAKCQFNIFNFVEQNDKLAKKYYLQVHTQMMALNVNKGYLINYLTKPEQWGEDNWTEYPFPLEDRFFIHEIERDESVCMEIIDAVETNHHLIDVAFQMQGSASLMDSDEFFYSQLVGRQRYLKLKEVNWVTNEREVIRHESEFYVKK